MAIVTPDQIRSLDPYSDHRFSNTINRFNRIFTGGEDTIMPFDNQEFTLTKKTLDGTDTIADVIYTWSANKSVQVGPGIVIKDDTLIHVKNSAYLDFTDPDIYAGSGTGYNLFDSTGKYFILIDYQYTRSIPAPTAKYVVLKPSKRSTFLSNRALYVYLGTANVTGTSGNYVISTVSLTDTDELNGNAEIKRPNYEFTLPIVDGGDLG